MRWFSLNFAILLIHLSTQENDSNTEYSSSGSGTGDLGDEVPSATTTSLQSLASLSNRETISTDGMTKNAKKPPNDRPTNKMERVKPSVQNTLPDSTRLDTLEEVKQVYKDLVSYLSKRTEIGKALSLPQILAQLAPPSAATTVGQRNQARNKLKLLVPYQKWRARTMSRKYPNVAAKHQEVSPTCFGENELCTPGQDDQCCGYASFCVDYFGVSKCLAFIKPDDSDLHDPVRRQQNINYKRYYSALLDTARYNIHYGQA